MQFAVLLSAILILVTHLVIKHRPRFRGFSCLRAGGKISERIVRVERGIAKGNAKLLNEIKIFNRMGLVMPCRRGVPVLYSQFLGRLVLDPSFVVRNSDGIARLLYVCAAMNLFGNSKEGIVRRQLMKNCVYVFGQKDVVKRKIPLRGGVAAKQTGWFSLATTPRFKYLGNQFIFAQNRKDRPSYTIYDGKKHSADKVLPVQCFETTAEKFVHFVAPEKFKYNLSHTADTFYAVGDGKAVGVYVPDKVTFGSSICEHGGSQKGDDLKVYATSEGDKYYVVTAKTKSEVTSIVGLLKKRRGKLDFLLTADEANEVTQIESLFNRAWSSRFVKGDNLKDKFATASKYVPTLFLPTLVYAIEHTDDFFAVVDSFKLFHRIAKTGNNMNVVFLYSSMHDEAREVIKAFADKDEARELIAAGVFLFFVDRIKADSKAVNYLSLMADAKSPFKIKGCPENRGGVFDSIETITHISNSFPITHTVYVRNTLKQPTRTKTNIPLDVGNELEGLPFGMPAICRRVGANLQVTSLKTGRSSTYKLPPGAVITDNFGRAIGDTEIACERVFIQCDIRLTGFEEKVLKIIKGEGGLSRSERKQAFLGSLENVKITSAKKWLNNIFGLEIVDGTNDLLVTRLKTAIKDYEYDVFHALLAKRETLTADIYALLIERVIGIKLLRGKIQLVPVIALTGSFELSFSYDERQRGTTISPDNRYNGTPYNFKVTERGSGFIINYGENEYKNFLQVSVN